MKQLFTNRQYVPPGKVPWLFMLLSIAMLTALGSWQMQRLVWKEGLLSKIEAGQQLVPLTQLPQGEMLEESLYRRVKLSGPLNRGIYFLRVGIQQVEGKGYYVLSPYLLSTISGENTYILVNRGFMSGTVKEVSDALDAETAQNPTFVEGILRKPRKARFFTPDNHPDKNIWVSEDLSAMELALDQKYSGVSAVLLPYVIEATDEQSIKGKTAPKPNTAKIRFRNDHFVYAMTWFSLALTGLVMFYFYCYRRKP